MKFSRNGRKCKPVFQLLKMYLVNIMYLGNEFSSSGSWNSTIANISNRRKKALFLLKGYSMFRKYKVRVRINTFRSDVKAYFMLWLRDLERI